MKRLQFAIVLIVLLFQGGAPAYGHEAAVPQQPGAAEQPLNSLKPDAITPPEQCGVPLRGPFGKDVEILHGGNQGAKAYQFTPVWKEQQPIHCASSPHASLVYSVAAVSSERIVAAWKDGTDLYQDTWDGSWTDSPQELPPLDQAPDGNPVVISPSSQSWEVYVRSGGQILQTSTITMSDEVAMTAWTAAARRKRCCCSRLRPGGGSHRPAASAPVLPRYRRRSCALPSGRTWSGGMNPCRFLRPSAIFTCRWSLPGSPRAPAESRRTRANQRRPASLPGSRHPS